MKNFRYWGRRAVVYRIFDASGRLIYVGQTINLHTRIGEHRSQAWWFKLLAHRIQIQLHATVEAARAAEKVAIQEETPVFNRLGYGNWRDDPYWSESDHQLYRAWYLRVNGYPALELVS